MISLGDYSGVEIMGPSSPPTAADYAQASASANARKIKALSKRIDELEAALGRFGLSIPESETEYAPGHEPPTVALLDNHRIMKVPN